jgi:hypothetical protein
MGKIKPGKCADFRNPSERRQIGSHASQNKEKTHAWPAFCVGGAGLPLLELRRFLYLYLLLASDPLGPPQNPAHKRSLFSEEQEKAAHGRQNNFHHLLSALQFPQERQGIFFD